MKNKRYIFFVLLFISCLAQAEVKLPKVLASHMVLQRNQPLPIWGTAAAGEAVRVTFLEQDKSAIANEAGEWEVILDPLSVSAAPAEMTISGTNTIVLKNILVGEVWLCSGQSNMEYTMNKSTKYAHAEKSKGLSKEAFEKIKIPDLRVFLVKRSLYENNEMNKGWEEADFMSLKDFSAIGFFFGEMLQEALDIPIGIIASASPGSPIERWAPEEVFASEKGFDPSLAKAPEVVDNMIDGKFYYGMIQPLAPFALKGFLWYQGETNAFKNEAFEYTDKMEALISTWRSIWRNEDLPFYYVQIAPFYYSQNKGDYKLTEETLPRFREAQAAALKIPNTAMVVTTDLVDSPEDLHPTYKWEIGRRLARVALAKVYGKKDIVYAGPQFKSMKTKGNKAIIKFTHTGSGLVSNDGKPLNWFTVAGKDGRFVPAKAVIKCNKIIVSAENISKPQAVRFAWDEAAQPNLFNKDGLPAMPFRSDGPEWHWPQ